MLHALGVGRDLHPVLGRAAARGHQRAGALDLDDADPARVHRREVVGETQRGRVDPLRTTCVEDRRALRDPHRLPVHLDVEEPAGRVQRDRAHALAPSASNRWSRCTADCTAAAAVWPSPQIDASRMTWAISSINASSCAREPISRPVHQSVQRLLLAHRAHAARDALAARLVAEEPGDPQHDVHQVDRLVQAP